MEFDGHIQFCSRLRRRFIWVFLILFCALSAQKSFADAWLNYAPLPTDGTDFWVTFMVNGTVHATDDGLVMTLIAVSHENHPISITVSNLNNAAWPSQTHTIPAHQTLYIDVPKAASAYLESSEQIEASGLYVKSTGTISLYAANSGNDSYDATIILPESVLSKEYIVQTYSQDQAATEFAIVATRNNTQILIQPSDTTNNSNNPNSYSHVPGSAFSVTLQKGQAYQVRSYRRTDCLSGSRICANHPIAVFAGNQAGRVPYRTSYSADHMYEQMVPIRYWGKKFIATLSSLQVINRYRVTAAENNTEVYVGGAQVATLQEYESYEGELTEVNPSAYIETSHRAICFLYLSSAGVSGNNDMGDASMVMVTPIEQFSPNITFGTFLDSLSLGASHYVNIVCPTNNINTIRIDNTIVGASNFSPVAGSNNQYQYARRPLLNGPHSIAGGSFSAYVYGMGDGESYAYSAGFNNIPTEYYMHINGQRVNSYTQCMNVGEISFDALGYGIDESDYNSVSWDFGDGTRSSGLHVTHLYESTGTYDLKLLINRDACFATNIASTAVVTDTVTASIKIFDTYNVSLNRKICEGESVSVGDQTFSTTGTYTIHLESVDGCDSIITLKLGVGHPETITYNKTACDSYKWHGTTYNQSGTYTWHGTSSYGCDSTEILNLIINSGFHNYQEVTICDTDTPYIWRGRQLYETNVYNDSLVTASGCDSVYSLFLTVGQTFRDSVDYWQCEGEEPLIWHGQTLSIAGVYYDSHVSKQGCDSTYVINFHVEQPFYNKESITVCASSLPYIWHGQSINQANTYFDRQKTSHDCDSIYELELSVEDAYFEEISVNVCPGETYTWRGRVLSETDTYTETRPSAIGCDSTFIIHFYVRPSYNDTINESICSNQVYHFYDEDISVAGQYTKQLHSQFGCDSIVTLILKVNPVKEYEYSDQICDSDLPYMFGDQALYMSDTYSRVIQSSEGCDSTIILHLEVLETTFNELSVITCQSAGPYPYGDHGKVAVSTGTYRDTLSVKNHFGCDSVLILHLTVLNTIIDVQYDTVCDTELPYNHPDVRATNLQGLTSSNTYRDTIKTINDCDSIIELHLIVGSTYEITDTPIGFCDDDSFTWNGRVLSGSAGTYSIDTILPTIYGCDSLVHLTYTIYPTFYQTETYTICDNEPFEWHGRTYKDLSIGEYTYYDRNQTVYGCDSIYELHLNVISSYYIRQTWRMCDNDSYTWEGRVYSGLSAGVYVDTVHYYTYPSGCDSIIELTLTVDSTYHHSYHTQICDNEEFYYVDHWLSFSAGDYRLDTMLTSVWGCDSAVTYFVTVYPTYEFVETQQLCFGEEYAWRGQTYSSTGIYTDSLQTIHGCDSVYVLELFVKPVVLIPLTIEGCDNERFVHKDTLWYPNNHWAEVNTTIWEPGWTIPETFTDVRFKGSDGCDSVVYRYTLTLHPAYEFHETDTICSAHQFIFENGHSLDYSAEYDVNQFVLPFDTILTDSLSTVGYGCDSVYLLYAHIYPEYRHVDYDTICDNGTTYWRGHSFTEMSAGDYIVRDSFQTIYGCDSIYELHLCVHPTYFFELRESICDNEQYDFNGRLIADTAGVYFYTDSLQTVYGCDSIYHLYLTVSPTSDVIIYDTICRGDFYVLNNRKIYDAGLYFDTIFGGNQYGCDSMITLYLEQIEPTRIQVEVSEICADEEEIAVYYTFEGREPIEYSVLFDSLGHAQGFEDIIHEPLDWRDGVLYVPVPHNEVLPHPDPTYYDTNNHTYSDDDKYSYPAPNLYPMTVFLHNGICSDSLIMSEKTQELLYPSWIIEQHWNDAIVLYNDKYNGGYVFSDYQWYQNDSLMIGQVREYLYLPDSLQYGVEYKVRLTRADDNYTTFTCPIVPERINNDTVVPREDYFSVVPTLIDHRNPVVFIETTLAGTYYLRLVSGYLIDSGSFLPNTEDVNRIVIPDEYAIPGRELIFDLYTIDHQHRNGIKVLIQ